MGTHLLTAPETQDCCNRVDEAAEADTARRVISAAKISSHMVLKDGSDLKLTYMLAS